MVMLMYISILTLNMHSLSHSSQVTTKCLQDRSDFLNKYYGATNINMWAMFAMGLHLDHSAPGYCLIQYLHDIMREAVDTNNLIHMPTQLNSLI
jgi:hypothetical protein